MPGSPRPHPPVGDSVNAGGAEGVAAGTWTLYIDGGARGNPGTAGAGAVVYDERGIKVAAESFPLGRLTNNAAEYEGLLRGLAVARAAGARRLEVRSDSELLVKQMQGEYRTRAAHLKKAVEQARSLLAGFTDVKFAIIPRERNMEADLLANRAMDSIDGKSRARAIRRSPGRS